MLARSVSPSRCSSSPCADAGEKSSEPESGSVYLAGMKSTSIRRNTLTLCLAALPTVGCFSVDRSGSMDADADTEGETEGEPSSSSDPTTPDPTTDPTGAPSTTGASTSDASTSSGNDDSDESGDDSSGSPSDETSGGVNAPTIVETLPADGAVGVAEDATIEIVFSEPMDQAATQAAYQSADLPAALVTFSWNDAGDRLTITPSELLAYNVADAVEDPARTYAFTITTTAESEDGVALEADVEVEFSTARLFLQYFPADGDLTGAVRDLEGPIGTGHLGDTNTNDRSRFFVSFDVSAMAPDVIELGGAEMTVTRGAQVSGNPFVDLGAVVFQHVQYDALDASTYDIAGIGNGDALFATAEGTEQTVDVAPALNLLLDDPDGYDHHLQFRFVWFPSEGNADGLYDSIMIDEGTNPPVLGVLYLAP